MPGNGSRPEIKEGDGTEVGDGGGSYLATRRGAEGKGDSTTQYCNLVSPEGGQELVVETLKDLNELWAESAASQRGQMICSAE